MLAQILKENTMRLGGPLFQPYEDPDSWIAALRPWGYTAAYAPQIPDGFTPADFASAAGAAGIRIAEVGVWNNPLSTDEAARRSAIAKCQEKLALAEELGAGCCVNTAGSRAPEWAGPHPDNLSAETFDLIVVTVREIIDAVKPLRTVYALETMPWIYPHSVESYVRLLEAIDRPAFGVHFDPVNLINSPERYFNNAALIQDFVAALGSHIKSVHAKDILLHSRLTTHLDEVQPGLGTLDYRTLLRTLDPLGPELPIMLEHLKTAEEYAQAASYVRGIAAEVGVQV
jgi:sugar phosphate isomerase/epimerase